MTPDARRRGAGATRRQQRPCRDRDPAISGPGDSRAATATRLSQRVEFVYRKWTRYLNPGPLTPNLYAVWVVNVDLGLSTTDGQPAWPMWCGESG